MLQKWIQPQGAKNIVAIVSSRIMCRINAQSNLKNKIMKQSANMEAYASCYAKFVEILRMLYEIYATI